MLKIGVKCSIRKKTINIHTLHVQWVIRLFNKHAFMLSSTYNRVVFMCAGMLCALPAAHVQPLTWAMNVRLKLLPKWGPSHRSFDTKTGLLHSSGGPHIFTWDLDIGHKTFKHTFYSYTRIIHSTQVRCK